MVLVTGKTQFLSNLLNFFCSVLFHCLLNFQTFLYNWKTSIDFFVLPIFWGRHGKHFRQPRQNFSVRGPKKKPKHLFCKSQLSARDSSAHVECSFDKSASIFLLEVRTFWNTSIFPKKTVFLKFFLEACKVQFYQPGRPLIALDHSFSLKLRKRFFVSCFSRKKFRMILGTRRL